LSTANSHRCTCALWQVVEKCILPSAKQEKQKQRKPDKHHYLTPPYVVQSDARQYHHIAPAARFVVAAVVPVFCHCDPGWLRYALEKPGQNHGKGDPAALQRRLRRLHVAVPPLSNSGDSYSFPIAPELDTRGSTVKTFLQEGAWNRCLQLSELSSGFCRSCTTFGTNSLEHIEKTDGQLAV
jgi:hypothetical protein